MDTSERGDPQRTVVRSGMDAVAPMRIGYLYPFRAWPPRGGNHLHAYQLGRAFLACGHQVLTLGDDSADGVIGLPATPQGVAELLRSIDVLYVRIDGSNLGDWPLAVSAIEQAAVPIVWEVNAAADERLSFSWLGGHRPLPAGRAGRLLDRTRRRLHATRQVPAIIREERLRARLARRVTAAVCVSRVVGHYAADELRIRTVRVIPNGSDPDLNHPGREPVTLPPRFQDCLKVLYAGSPIYPWQGFDLICRTVALHRASAAPLAFVFLVNQRAGSIPEGDNIIVCEGVPYEDVAGYITAADVCLSIHPEHFWTNRGFHGSPTKLFDYMACGRTVVASRVGQLAEVIRDGVNGILCENTPEDLLAKLSWLAERRDLLPEMGARARADVLERYNWTHIAAETLLLFEQVR